MGITFVFPTSREVSGNRRRGLHGSSTNTMSSRDSEEVNNEKETSYVGSGSGSNP